MIASSFSVNDRLKSGGNDDDVKGLLKGDAAFHGTGTQEEDAKLSLLFSRTMKGILWKSIIS